jgi:hypothetical protein
MERMQGREGALVLVNGQHQPAIPAVLQATQRWRIVNTCVAREDQEAVAGEHRRT